MKALIYTGSEKLEVMYRWIGHLGGIDAVVRVLHASICGTGLHVLKNDVPDAHPVLLLGREGVGVVSSIDSAVQRLQLGDRELISRITSSDACQYCQRVISAHCRTGGRQLRKNIDGTQAECVRVPHAALSLHPSPASIDPKAAVALSDALATGLEHGVPSSNGFHEDYMCRARWGFAILLTAQLSMPSSIVRVDLGETRHEMARKFSAHATVSSSNLVTQQRHMDMTQGEGFESFIEAVGIPAAFAMCHHFVAVGGWIANVGARGTSVGLQLEYCGIEILPKTPSRNGKADMLGIHMSLVNVTSTPRLLRLMESGMLNIGSMRTHRTYFLNLNHLPERCTKASTT
ncbi:uncharacterized protein N7477_001272 [Penicillium maclennaniae]|uniref:uncharacterized protein n=1 Tax=Penicillium maclennaniae TaxID=1343394 RepID=UPI0025403EB7|nr:uncharacterized protein N7477_001272 [Penicillium maclennaniae]KAJ5681332.1 hypothetical protein N7477_001272 [Penicillium maclennaniae]